MAAGCRLPIFSGDDALTLPMMAVGAVGVVSVVSNICPARIVAMVRHALDGDFASARADHLALVPLFKGMFIETNPVPVKVALHAMRLIRSPAVRLPLAPLDASNEPKVRAALESSHLLPVA